MSSRTVTGGLSLQRVDERIARFSREYPPLLQVLLLFLFFLPLLSVQVPGITAGISLNPARLFSLIAVLLVLATKCMYPTSALSPADGPSGKNQALNVLLVFLVLSVVYYYVMLVLGETVRFGNEDSFFRGWRGKPVAQLLALLTYAVIPYWLILRYGSHPRRWRMIGGTLVAASLLLVGYGFFQQFSYYFGLPVTGRLLYEGPGEEIRLATFSVGGMHFLRFYSLGGEPRDYGAFAVGATFLYVAWRYGRGFSWLVAGAMVASILLTLSSSAFLVLGIIGAVVFIDAIRNGWIGPVAMLRTGILLLISAATLFLSGMGDHLIARPAEYWRAMGSLFEFREEMAFLLQAQAPDLGALFYVLDLPQLPLHRILFGFGFGNFGTGMHDILLERFHRDILADGILEESRSYFVKMLVEVGIVGLALFGYLFVRTVRLGTRLVKSARSGEERVRMIALRYAYMAFFVAAMVQVSFYHFLIMGLVETAPRAVEPAPPETRFG